MLTWYIQQVFEMQNKAEQMAAAAKVHAQQTHDPERNKWALLEIYEKIMK